MRTSIGLLSLQTYNTVKNGAPKLCLILKTGSCTFYLNLTFSQLAPYPSFARKRRSGIKLTDNYKRLRLVWAMQYCHCRSQWSRVGWCDEASACLRLRDGRLRVWIQLRNEIPGNLSLPVRRESKKRTATAQMFFHYRSAGWSFSWLDLHV